VTFIVTVRWLPRGRVATVDEDERPEISADPGFHEVR
jgi:hypothetical protein